MANIFISYARPTLSQARLIAETLQKAGHEVWIDDQLLSHRSFTDAIEEQLNAADAVVVVWSSDAVRSEWVRAEANRAREAGKLVQVMFGQCALPMPFDQIHCIDLTSWSGDYEVPRWRSVLASVAAVTGGVHGGPPLKAAADKFKPVGAERRGERRQVTALYCDLVDSGALSTRLDPEDMMQVLDVYQAACDDIIAHHGGAIAKSTSHGVLAYFGYPRGDEEEAANAVRAGLALCDAVGGLDLPAGIALRTRVGVATGLVVIGDLVGRGETGVVGETPNLATRLESIASPGGVVVAEATRRITEGLFTYRDLGAMTLPGYEAPIKAFEAVEATAVASRSQARTQNETTSLFGRETELALLFECWTLAREGEGQVALIQGEAGIGKSRLVESFRRRVADTPSAQSTWYCAPNYSDSALHPVSEQFARAAGFERGDGVETRRDKLAKLLDQYGATGLESHDVLADLLGIPPEAGGSADALTPERRKAVTLDTLLVMMDGSADAQPALFVIEDLHWADPTTLELLDRATRRAADKPWLILATARPEFETRWSDHADLTHIQLSRLNGVDAARICTELGAEAVLTADVVRQIIERSDGIPLFVEEMTKAVLEAMATAATAEGALRVVIPNTLQDSLAARLDRLGSAKQVASLGAAIGRRFSYELLAAVAPQPAAELRQALRELAKSGLIERSGVPPDSQYLFKHALIRDAAYESLLKREREALHGRIADALRDRFPETLQLEPALVAYHLTEGGGIAEAIPLWAEAGQRAASRAAHVEAVSHLGTALDLLRRLPGDGDRAELELQLLLGLAVSLAATRGYSVPEVGKVLAEARAICDSLGNVADLFAVLRGICSFSLTASDLVAAEETAHRCREIGEQTGQVVHQIEADHALGYLMTMKGDLPAARQHLERAVRSYRQNDGLRLAFPSVPGPLVLCLGVLPLVLEAMGDTVGAERAAEEMAEHLPSLGRNYDQVFGLTWHATYDLINKNYPRALDFAEQALQICEENSYDLYAVVATTIKGAALGRRGDLNTAIDMVARGIREFNRFGVMSMITFWTSELADLQAAAGDVTAALSTIDRAIAHALEFGDRYFLSPAYLRRGQILARIPGADPVEVRSALQESIGAAEAQGATAFAAQAKSLLVGATA